jgi:bacterioferritin-associated ferredoxin
MIICSCNVLTDARIMEMAERLAADDPMRPLTPGRLFRALAARPNCGTCFSAIRTMIADAGLVFTCPEPLASVAEAAEDEEELDIFAVMDV